MSQHVSESLEQAVSWDWQSLLADTGYIADENLTRMMGLATAMSRPLLLEGPAGVGKTSLATAVSRVLGRELIRLQCYEGISAEQALYEWNYHKQFAALTVHQTTDVFDETFLLERPLLRALREPSVLLIDEIDRADEGFEALLLEFLGEYKITIPEWREQTTAVPPVVLLTSNRTRPLSDALRRRSLYHRFDWPDAKRETEVVRTHFPDVPEGLAEQVVEAVQTMRTWNLIKPPGVAETLDWVGACWLSQADWNETWARQTLGCVIKDVLDMEVVKARVGELFSGDT